VVDAGLAADGAAASMLRAWAMTDAMAPRTSWEFNADRTAVVPMFAWIHSPIAGPLTVTVRWGVFAVIETVDIGDGGVLFTSPLQLSNPPIRVFLDRPGWVAFGPGAIPAELGITTVRGLSVLRFRSDATYFSNDVRRLLKAIVKTTGLSLGTLPQRLSVSGELVQQVSDHSSLVDHVATTFRVEARPPTGSPFIDGDQIRRTLRAHGVSEREAARLATHAIGLDVTRERLRRLGRPGRVPATDRLLAAWLDRWLGGDGHMMCVEIDRRTSPIIFPDWWRGPVWIQAQQACTARLRWGRYVKEVEFGESGTCCWTRCASPADALHIETSPPGGTFRTGLGHRPGSADINDRWLPTSRASLNEIRSLTTSLALGTLRQRLPTRPLVT
jgi:hypothetical protein